MLTYLLWIEGLGWKGVGAFVVLYVLACILFLPGSFLTLGAGVLFGVTKGVVVISISSTLGATVAFLIGRYLARNWVARQIEKKPFFRAVDEAILKEGWKIVLLARLSPLFPFNFLNYALGLTQVRVKEYVLASWVGMLPGTLLYVYLGSLAGNLAVLGRDNRQKTTGEWIFYGVGLLATGVVTLYVTRLSKRALAQKISKGE